MVRLPWLPVLAQSLRDQASSADASHTRIPQLPPPLLDVLHSSKLGLKGGRRSSPHATSQPVKREAVVAPCVVPAALVLYVACVGMQQHD